MPAGNIAIAVSLPLWVRQSLARGHHIPTRAREKLVAVHKTFKESSALLLPPETAFGLPLLVCILCAAWLQGAEPEQVAEEATAASHAIGERLSGARHAAAGAAEDLADDIRGRASKAQVRVVVLVTGAVLYCGFDYRQHCCHEAVDEWGSVQGSGGDSSGGWRCSQVFLSGILLNLNIAVCCCGTHSQCNCVIQKGSTQ